MRRIISAILSILIIETALVGCSSSLDNSNFIDNSKPLETSGNESVDIEPTLPEYTAISDWFIDYLSENINLSDEEYPVYFSWLLENGSHLEEINLDANYPLSSPINTYQWYLKRRLDKYEIQVQSWERLPVATGGSGHDYKFEVTLIELNQDIGSEKQAVWILRYGSIDDITFEYAPVDLISLDEYLLRNQVWERYFNEIAFIQDFRRKCYDGSFSNIKDVPIENLVFYVLLNLAIENPNVYEFTYDEVNAAALDIIGIPLNPTESIPSDHPSYDYYDASTRIYNFYIPSMQSRIDTDYYWRADGDENGLHIFYFKPGSLLEYTIVNDRIISAVEFSSEDHPNLGQILGDSDTSLAFMTPKHCTEIRQNIPYKPNNPIPIAYPIATDEIGKALTEIIYKGTFHTLPGASFQTPADESAQSFCHEASIYATSWYQWSNPNWSETYRVELEAFEPFLDGYTQRQIYLKEHVELTAKELFGDEFAFQHGQWGAIYIAEAGIYLPSFLGKEYGYHPVVLSYTEYHDRYEVITVFPAYTDKQFVYSTNIFETIPEDELKNHLQNELKKHVITLKKTDDGGLLYYSHIIPDM